jgi:hypothetical protein
MLLLCNVHLRKAAVDEVLLLFNAHLRKAAME